MSVVTIGTRGSKLALTQANIVAGALRQAHPGLEVRVIVISTKGDRVLDVALSKIGDKGLFVKELETALLAGEIDIAVHSAKDLPSRLPDGLTLAAFLPRGDVRDAVVVRATAPLSSTDDVLSSVLPRGAHIGTSSLRRMCQLRAARPDLRISDVRGNVDTRLRKLAEGQFDALVLAAAGLERLGFIERGADGQPITVDLWGLNAGFIAHDATKKTPEVLNSQLVAVPLPTTVMLPAVAQGVLAIETRADDEHVQALLHPLNDADTQSAAIAERAFLRALEGGCQVPIAAYAHINRGRVWLTGLIGSLDGASVVHDTREDAVHNAEVLGNSLATHLLDAGGRDILAALRARETQRPLEHMRVVITRAEGRSDGLATRLRELGAEPILYPVIAYAPPDDRQPLDDALQMLVAGKYDWLALTSVTAVEVVKAWLVDRGMAALPAIPTPIAVVGPATAQACLELLGQQPAVMPDAFAAEHLAHALSLESKPHTLAQETNALQDSARQPVRFSDSGRGQRVLLLNADIAKPTLETALRDVGAEVDRVIAYRTVPASGNGAALSAVLDADAITFTSGSTVRHFVERLDPASLSAVQAKVIVCIGPTTAEAAREAGLTPTAVAAEATEEGLVEALVQTVQRNPLKRNADDADLS